MEDIKNTNHNSILYIDSFKIIKATMSYAVYILKGSFLTSDIQRRYSDFYILRKALAAKWPCLFIPQIPPKKTTGNLDSDFLELRMRLLNHFLDRITEAKEIFNSDEVKLFISPGDNFKSAVSNLPGHKYSELVQKYLAEIEGYSEDYDLAEGQKNLSFFHSVLENSKGKLQILSDELKDQLKGRNKEIKYAVESLNILKRCEQLIPHQTNYLTDRKISTIKGPFSIETNPLKDFYYSVVEMQNDVNGYLEAYNTLQEYKLEEHRDKERLKAIQANGQSTEINRINALKIDIPNIQAIIKIATYYLEKSIKKFKKEQIKLYNKEVLMLKGKVIDKEKYDLNLWSGLATCGSSNE